MNPQNLAPNGMPRDLTIEYDCCGVPFRSYPQSRELVENLVKRSARFMMIRDGAIPPLDWRFYQEVPMLQREGLNLMLWAAGLLTSTKLDSLAIRETALEDSHYGPVVRSLRLYFPLSRLSDAEAYLERVALRDLAGKVALEQAMAVQMASSESDLIGVDERELEIVHCIQVADYVRLKTPVAVS